MSHFVRLYIVLFFLLFLGAGLWPVQAAERLRTISTAELQRIMVHQPDQKPFVLINSLSPIEFDAEAIKGSVNIPATHTRANNPLLPRDKDVLLIFYCKGVRCSKSRLAARKAMRLGYRDVRVYMPGLPGWKEMGLPLETRVSYPQPGIAHLTPRQVYEQRQTALILDIRGDEVRQLGSLAGAVKIALENLDQRFDGLPKNRQIIIVDHAGKQASICARFLYLHGYTTLAILEGGMVAWVREGLPVEERGGR